MTRNIATDPMAGDKIKSRSGVIREVARVDYVGCPNPRVHYVVSTPKHPFGRKEAQWLRWWGEWVARNAVEIELAS